MFLAQGMMMNGTFAGWRIVSGPNLRIWLLTALLTILSTLPAAAAGPVQLAHLGSELSQLSLRELMDVEVTSAARKEATVAQTAAAVFVISREDIRRSGATSIPELLRMVPGLMVARIDANKWAVSARSFNSLIADKLLVLMDGRSVYSTLFHSTFWDVQDTLLEDIDRIEVIRGPGATLWGANAVNGVINIITAPANTTQGTLLSAGGGSEERAFGALRHGGRLGPDAYWRAYVKSFDRDDSLRRDGPEAADDWQATRGGFRLDWLPAGPDSLTVQGDAYAGRSGLSAIGFDGSSALAQTYDDEAEVGGAYLLSRWKHVRSDRSRLELQAYWDWTDRDSRFLDERRHTFDLDLQQTLRLGARHELVWGAQYRYIVSTVENGPTIAFDPERRIEHIYGLFLQDEITLVPSRLKLTAGAKLEHNSYTEVELQPTLRLLWTPRDDHSFWTALSRATRTPGRFDRESRILVPVSSGPTPVVGVLSGNEGFDSERVTALEVGYRYHPPAAFSLDLAAFYNWYDCLRSFEIGATFPEATPAPAHTVIPGRIDNKLEGETYGVEAAADWQPVERLQLQAAYTYFAIAIRHEELGDDDIFAKIEEEKSPRHQASLRTSVDLGEDVELDLWLRYVDRLRRGDIPAYLQLDTRLAWAPLEGLELSVVGQNLLDGHHPEFFKETVFNVLPTEVQRGVYAKADWRF